MFPLIARARPPTGAIDAIHPHPQPVCRRCSSYRGCSLPNPVLRRAIAPLIRRIVPPPPDTQEGSGARCSPLSRLPGSEPRDAASNPAVPGRFPANDIKPTTELHLPLVSCVDGLHLRQVSGNCEPAAEHPRSALAGRLDGGGQRSKDS